jgi:hypothetical protein
LERLTETYPSGTGNLTGVDPSGTEDLTRGNPSGAEDLTEVDLSGKEDLTEDCLCGKEAPAFQSTIMSVHPYTELSIATKLATAPRLDHRGSTVCSPAEVRRFMPVGHDVFAGRVTLLPQESGSDMQFHF